MIYEALLARPYYLALGIFAVVGLLYFNGSVAKTHKETHNRYIMKSEEILPDVSYYTYRPDQIRNIIWTGDLQSIWLVCYYFIAADQPVQIIYLADKQNTGLAALIEIRTLLLARFPYKRNRLLPTYYVTNITKNNEIARQFKNLQLKNPIYQKELQRLERVARFAADWKYPVYYGIDRTNPVVPILGQITGEWDTAVSPDKHLNNLRFPIIHLTTDDLVRFSLESKTYFYDFLLKSS